MSKLMRSMMPMLGAAVLLSACGSLGWGQKSKGETHTLTGGAEAAPTSESTPQPARPRGDTSGKTTDATSGGASGGATGGDATTGGAEAAPTDQATPSRP